MPNFLAVLEMSIPLYMIVKSNINVVTFFFWGEGDSFYSFACKCNNVTLVQTSEVE